MDLPYDGSASGNLQGMLIDERRRQTMDLSEMLIEDASATPTNMISSLAFFIGAGVFVFLWIYF